MLIGKFKNINNGIQCLKIAQGLRKVYGWNLVKENVDKIQRSIYWGMGASRGITVPLPNTDKVCLKIRHERKKEREREREREMRERGRERGREREREREPKI